MSEDKTADKIARRMQDARDFDAMMRWAVATGRFRSAHEEPSLGDAIREARQARRRMTAELALRAGVSKERWLQWEADQEIPSEDELVRVLAALKVESPYGFWRRWRNAPRRQLGLALREPESFARVARSVDPRKPVAAAGYDPLLAVLNLDPLVRMGLAAWCRSQGRPDDEAGLVSMLTEVRTMDIPDRERWLWQVNRHLRPDEESEE